MNYHEITEALELHHRAWALLRDGDRSGRIAGRDFDVALAETLADPAAPRVWLERNLDNLRAEERPSRAQLDAFARLVSSFFTTSLRPVDYAGHVHLEASVGRSLNGRRKRKRGIVRMSERVESLRRFACRELLFEDCELGDELPDEVWDKLRTDADLTLWTYAVELYRRTRFASQGQAVHALWLALPEENRAHLDASCVWEARQRVSQRLEELTEQFTAA